MGGTKEVPLLLTLSEHDDTPRPSITVGVAVAKIPYAKSLYRETSHKLS